MAWLKLAHLRHSPKIPLICERALEEVIEIMTVFGLSECMLRHA